MFINKVNVALSFQNLKNIDIVYISFYQLFFFAKQFFPFQFQIFPFKQRRGRKLWKQQTDF